MPSVVLPEHEATIAAAEKHERPLARAMLAAFMDLRDAVPHARLVELLSSGADPADVVAAWPWRDVLAVPESVGLDAVRLLAKSAGDDIEDVLVRTVVAGSEHSGVIDARLDVTNPHAIQAAQEQAVALVGSVRRGSERTVRALVTRATRGELTVDEVARLLRTSIGLTPRQAQAVANYSQAVADYADGRLSGGALRSRYAMADRGMIRGGYQSAGMTDAQQAKAVDRYSARWLKFRAETIARTETLKAVNKGLLLSWEQAVAEGYLSSASLMEWIATGDDRTCFRCSQLDGTRILLGAQFTVPGLTEGDIAGVSLESQPPVHPRCRCTLGVVAITP